MTTITILYPNTSGSRFDLRYYVDTHMPLAIKLLSAHAGYQGVSVEHGLGGALPGTDAAYVAICRFQFDTAESFMAAFMAHAAVLQGDIPNYTDVQPIIQLNELLIVQ